jgi:hypothetical protein
VHIQALRKRQPPHHKAKPDQQAAADELASLLESHRDLPAEKQHEARTEREQYRMTNGKLQRKAERAAVSRGTKRRRERQRGDGHEVIGAETVKETERKH